MKALIKSVVVAIGLTGVMISNASAGDFFTDQGSIWTGGYVGFVNQQYRNQSDPYTMVMVSPVFRYFPCQYLLVGPSLAWSTVSRKNYSSYTLSAGPEIGFAFGNNIPVIPYALVSMQYLHSEYTSSSSFSTASYTSLSEGYLIPLATGIMIPLVDGLGFQVETGYRYYHYKSSGSMSDEGLFYIAFGVCGIGKRFAISLQNLFLN